MLTNPINWLVEHFRVTIFPALGQEIDLPKMFLEIAGTDPDETHAKKDAGRQVMVVSDEDQLLQLVSQPDRVHWYLGANTNAQIGSSTFPTFGEDREKLPQFKNLCEKWLSSESLPGIVRIAYGAGLFFPVDSRLTGYKLIQDLVPSIELQPENNSEFLFQINRWRTLDNILPGLRINRLAKWAVLSMRHANLYVSPSGFAAKQQDEVYAVRLDLDISTGQEWSEPFSSKIIGDLMYQLIELGEEIAHKGDVP